MYRDDLSKVSADPIVSDTNVPFSVVDKTVVLVSHRQSTMRMADTVYCVEHGRMS